VSTSVSETQIPLDVDRFFLRVGLEVQGHRDFEDTPTYSRNLERGFFENQGGRTEGGMEVDDHLFKVLASFDGILLSLKMKIQSPPALSQTRISACAYSFHSLLLPSAW
jgi:hypothetical protein